MAYRQKLKQKEKKKAYLEEFHQLRNDDKDFAEQYGKDEFKEWYNDYKETFK